MKGEEPTKADVKRAALRVINGDAEPKPRKTPRQRPEPVAHSQHDRDLTMILGVWDATCGSAQSAFLDTICIDESTLPPGAPPLRF